MSLLELDSDQLKELADRTRKNYEELKAKGLKLDLTRGKPSAEQLDLADELLSLPGVDNYTDKNGTDLRNYGNGEGIADIRELWGELLGINPAQLLAADSSSLNIQFDLISWSCAFGNNDSEKPWFADEQRKWICPVPGYDRHHTISEQFGFENVTVPMLEDGPDVDAIAELAKDPSVKGMWAVPMFSNPTGVTFSKESIEKLAAMETASPDFRIMWDNAYAVHTLTDEFPEIIDVLGIAEKAGNPNRFWVLSSTSKITFAGAGVAFFASSEANIADYVSHASIRGIGPNKVNQLAHLKFFGDADGVRAQMLRHKESLAPKFDRVLELLEKRLGEYGVAEWTTPKGGYFISLDVVDGTARRVIELAKEAGIALTGSGSSFPLKDDPNDRNIRLAPSLPPIEELEAAMDGVATCVLLAAAEQFSAR